MEEDTDHLPLHLCHVQKTSAIINRSHTLLHSTALIALFYYRASFLFQNPKNRASPTLILPIHLLLFSSELILSFIWFLGQAFRWRPVSRSVFPERLPENEALPAIDVLICTADPSKEPTMVVMNTVISAMALDYPIEKLHVYLSDDGGCSVTLHAMKEAWRFAKWWVPFCRAHGVKTRCPDAYFAGVDADEDSWSSEFVAEREKVKEKYENFKERVTRIIENESIMVNRDHSPVVEVINHKSIDEVVEAEIPLLVYVSREKRASYTHHFKAGALNTLLRVSAMTSNSPYILVLDCDMYCNDPTSARQAMCFHLDPNKSPSLAFVQFPQRFHNVSKTDIYDRQLRSIFKIQWKGMDGLEGPGVCGSGFYMKRDALYRDPTKENVDVKKLKSSFGPSNEFIKSLGQHYINPNHREFSSVTFLKETQFLASCAYENQTKWGEEVGFLYYSVCEDFFTGLIGLHCKGWTSVYCDPAKAAFLGLATTNLNDLLVQGTRWNAGMIEVGLSRFCPLIYGPKKISAFEAMCYAQLALHPLYFLPMWCLATIPQLCLLNGIPLYPEVSNHIFIVFTFIFLSSHFKHMQEVFSTGGTILTWRNEQMMWMIKSVTCNMYGSLDAIMKIIGIRETNFLITNKVVDDDEQFKRYQIGKFDFQTSTMLLVPVVTLVILNLISLIGGVARVVATESSNEMFIQVFLSFFIVTMSYPIIEGIVLRKDKGRVSPSVTFLSAIISMIFLFFGSIILMYL